MTLTYCLRCGCFTHSYHATDDGPELCTECENIKGDRDEDDDPEFCEVCECRTESIITGGSPRQYDSPEEIYWGCAVCRGDKGTAEVK